MTTANDSIHMRLDLLTSDVNRLRTAFVGVVKQLADHGLPIDARTVALALADEPIMSLAEPPVSSARISFTPEPTNDVAERRRARDRERKRAKKAGDRSAEFHPVPRNSPLDSAPVPRNSTPDSAERSAEFHPVPRNSPRRSAEIPPAPCASAGALSKTSGSLGSSSDLSSPLSSPSSPSLSDPEINASADTSRAHEPSAAELDDSTGDAPPAPADARDGRRTDRRVWGMVDRFAAACEREDGSAPVFKGPIRYERRNGKPANAHARFVAYDGAKTALDTADRLMPRTPVDERCNVALDAFTDHIRDTARGGQGKLWKAFRDHAAESVERAIRRLERLRKEAEEADRARTEAATPRPDARAAVGRLSPPSFR